MLYTTISTFLASPLALAAAHDIHDLNAWLSTAQQQSKLPEIQQDIRRLHNGLSELGHTSWQDWSQQVLSAIEDRVASEAILFNRARHFFRRVQTAPNLVTSLEAVLLVQSQAGQDPVELQLNRHVAAQQLKARELQVEIVRGALTRGAQTYQREIWEFLERFKDRFRLVSAQEIARIPEIVAQQHLRRSEPYLVALLEITKDAEHIDVIVSDNDLYQSLVPGAPNREELVQLIPQLPHRQPTMKKLRAEIRKVGRILRLNHGNSSYTAEQRSRQLYRELRSRGVKVPLVTKQVENTFDEYIFAKAFEKRFVHFYGAYGLSIGFFLINKLPAYYQARFSGKKAVSELSEDLGLPALASALSAVAQEVKRIKGWQGERCEYERSYVAQLKTLMQLRNPRASLVYEKLPAAQFLSAHELVYRLERDCIERGWAPDRSTLRATLDDLIYQRTPPPVAAPLGFLWDLLTLWYQRSRRLILEQLQDQGPASASALCDLIRNDIVETVPFAEQWEWESESVLLFKEMADDSRLTAESMLGVLLNKMLNGGNIEFLQDRYQIGRDRDIDLEDFNLRFSYQVEQELFQELLSIYRGLT